MTEPDHPEEAEQPQEQDIGAAVTPEEHEARRERIRRLKQELVGDLLTTAEVAEILEVHPRTVGEYVRDGRLSAINLGGGWKVTEHELRRFVQDLTKLSVDQGEARPKGGQSGGMFANFTQKARKIIVAAQRNAREMNHNYIGTEHLLLGLLEDEGVASMVLIEMGLDFGKAKAGVLSYVKAGEAGPIEGHIPFTPRAKSVLELALKEALARGNRYVASEHLLLGLIGEAAGIGAKVVEDATSGLVAVRERVETVLGGDPPEAANP